MNTSSQSTAGAVSCQQRGVTLIELLIALAFGLVLILATMSVYMANNQTFRQVENLSRLNENARIAFELLGREFREAGSTPCGNTQVSNVLNVPNNVNWSMTQKGITPFGANQEMPTKAFGSGAAARVQGTDAIIITGSSNDLGIRVESHNANAASLKLNKLGGGFQDGEIVLACDFNFATIFQITNIQATNVTLVHNTGTGTPGNCTKVLYKPGEQVSCSSTNGAEVTGASIVKVISTSWYIANNGRGGRSLYRIVSPSSTPEEMVENVTNMQIEYLVTDAIDSEPFDYVISSHYGTTIPRPVGVTSGNYTWWPTNFNIVAARVNLTLETASTVGTDGKKIIRQVTTVFNLRNQIY